MYKYVDQKGLAAILAIKRSASVAPKVSKLMHAGNESHPDFEAKGRCHQASTTGVSMAPQKELLSSKIKKKDVCTGHCHNTRVP